jgi:hypothetical protein
MEYKVCDVEERLYYMSVTLYDSKWVCGAELNLKAHSFDFHSAKYFIKKMP